MTDDGNPSASVALAWSKASGPSTVIFSAPTALTTVASFSQPGVYLLAITADDGQAKTVDEIAVNVTTASEIAVVATDNRASRSGGNVGMFTISRTGNVSAPLSLNFSLTGTATAGVDYFTQLGSAPVTVTIPSGAWSTNVVVVPFASSNVTPVETVHLAITPGSGYSIGPSGSATVFLDGIFGQITSVAVAGGRADVAWVSTPGKVYRVLYKDDLSEPVWREILGDITATGSLTTFSEGTAFRAQRFYHIMEVR
jgi:hypothetical protein